MLSVGWIYYDEFYDSGCSPSEQTYRRAFPNNACVKLFVDTSNDDDAANEFAAGSMKLICAPGPSKFIAIHRYDLSFDDACLL
jgi:hypothetical protein